MLDETPHVEAPYPACATTYASVGVSSVPSAPQPLPDQPTEADADEFGGCDSGSDFFDDSLIGFSF